MKRTTRFERIVADIVTVLAAATVVGALVYVTLALLGIAPWEWGVAGP